MAGDELFQEGQLWVFMKRGSGRVMCICKWHSWVGLVGRVLRMSSVLKDI